MLSKLEYFKLTGVRKNTKRASLGARISQTPDTGWLAVVDDGLEFEDGAVVVVSLLDHSLIPYSYSWVAGRPSREEVVLI